MEWIPIVVIAVLALIIVISNNHAFPAVPQSLNSF